MNLTNFLKQTDELTAQYSTEQLITFIHDIARIFPEHHRENFLERLRLAGGGTKKVANNAVNTCIDCLTKNTEKEIEFTEMYNHIKNNFNLIESQEVMITEILNEEYDYNDEYYDDEEEEFYYEDNDGISDMLAEACDFVHMCMDREQYQEGFAIGNQMLSMKILCDGEYEDEFSLEDMVYHELLYCDLKQVIFDIAYCAYHAAPLAKRPEILYEVIVNTNKDEITLETIMQYGDKELPDFEDFLPL